MSRTSRIKKWGLLFLIVCLSPLWPNDISVSAREITEGRNVSVLPNNCLDAERIRCIQRILRSMGYSHGTDDGIWGQQTENAFLRCCQDLAQGMSAAGTGPAAPIFSFILTEQDFTQNSQRQETYQALAALQPSTDQLALGALVSEKLKELPETSAPYRLPLVISLPAPQTDAEPAPLSYQVNPNLLKQIASQLIPDETLEKLHPIQEMAFAPRKLFEAALANAVTMDKQQAAVIVNGSKKKLPLEKTTPIQWRSADCGCAPDFSGIVYGICSTEKELSIDYSALSRIGYFSLFVDAQGRLQKHQLWPDTTKRADFIKAAHQHRTQVDLIVRSADWRSIATNGAALNTALIRLIKTTPGFDGITLYLDQYPDNAVSLRAFSQYLKTLTSAVKPIGPQYQVNLMLPAVSKNDTGTIEKLNNLLGALFPEKAVASQAEPSPVDLLLIFIDAPTSANKKELRYLIEKAFKGIQRRTVLRKIIPVILPPGGDDDTKGLQQFEDDLIYFEDNFGGVGLWPIPTADLENITLVKQKIESCFNNPADNNLFEKFSVGILQGYCRLICPQRAWVRSIFVINLVFLAAWMIGAGWICELRSLLKRLWWCFVGLLVLAFLLMLSLMTCDPSWTRYSTGIAIALAVILIVFTIYRQIRKMQQASFP